MRPIAKLLLCAFVFLTGCAYSESETLDGKDYDVEVHSYEHSSRLKGHFVRVHAPFKIGFHAPETLDGSAVAERLEAFGIVAEKTAKKFCKSSPVVWDAGPIVLTSVSSLLMYSGHQGGASLPHIWEGGGDPPPRVYERLFHCEGSG